MVQYIHLARIHHLVQEIGGRQTFFWSKFDIQSAGVTLKMRPRSPKSKIFFLPHVSVVFVCKFGQNPPISSGNKSADKAHFYSLFSVVTLKLDQGHQNLTDSFNYSNDTIHTFGQNPSFGSRDRVQTSFFWLKFDIQSAGVTLKMRSRSPKSKIFFFPMSQWCFYASLVKIHQLVQEIECRQCSFLQSL